MSKGKKQYRMRMFGSKGRCKCKNMRKCKMGKACYYKKAEAALMRAHDIRKFEIDLLWRRAAYVGTFQTLLFAALGASFSADKLTPESEFAIDFLRLAICVAGIFIAFFWYLINKGSKFWHENWERHIDCLENEFEGKLHKTVLHKHERKCYSVSRVNINISLVFFVAWGVLAPIFAFNFFGIIDEHVECPACAKTIMLIVLILVVGAFLEYRRRDLKTRFKNTSEGENIYRVKRKPPNRLMSSPLVDR